MNFAQVHMKKRGANHYEKSNKNEEQIEECKQLKNADVIEDSEQFEDNVDRKLCSL